MSNWTSSRDQLPNEDDRVVTYFANNKDELQIVSGSFFRELVSQLRLPLNWKLFAENIVSLPKDQVGRRVDFLRKGKWQRGTIVNDVIPRKGRVMVKLDSGETVWCDSEQFDELIQLVDGIRNKTYEYTVYGTVKLNVKVKVFADSEKNAIKKARKQLIILQGNEAKSSVSVEHEELQSISPDFYIEYTRAINLEEMKEMDERN